MFDLTRCNLGPLSAHIVGNKIEDQGIKHSDGPLDISDNHLRELLLNFFLKDFKVPQYFKFTFADNDHRLNPLYTLAYQIFNKELSFHQGSKSISNYLYDCSTHHNIKPGDFYLGYFSDILIEDELVDALGIFKIESKTDFIKLKVENSDSELSYDKGVDLRKLDKGCLIFNTDSDDGYRLCVVDNTNKSSNAFYWKDSFLNVVPIATSFNVTDSFLSITKNFISEEVKLEKADQSDLLNKSINFFKSNQHFDKSEFDKTVLEDQHLIKSFSEYQNQSSLENGFLIQDSFDISKEAVKKKNRIFKSVLKLDKNFHVYIHGNRNLIEKGVDAETGKKYYKLYFDDEA